MRFIENWFGVWPDDGDGSLEIMVLVLMVVLAALIGMWLPIGSKLKDETKIDK